MLSLDIALSTLRTAQQANQIIGQNVANANNPNYHRQVADLAAIDPTTLGNFQFGTGVELTRIRQLRDSLLEQAIGVNTSGLSSSTARVNVLQQIESALGQGDGSLGNNLKDFFRQLDQLAAQPGSLTLRRAVVNSATAITNRFNSLATDFDNIKFSLRDEIQANVDIVNTTTAKIAELNGEILYAVGRGLNPNDLRDQRDGLINQLASQVNARVVETNQGIVNIVTDGGALVVGAYATKLTVTVDPSDKVIINGEGFPLPLEVTGGKLGGLLAIRNTNLPDYQTRLDQLADLLGRKVNEIQTTGLGPAGPATFLGSENQARSVTTPLAAAGLPNPVVPGKLYVSVTNLATGARTLTALDIDPTTQSLQDVAVALSGIPNIQAVTNAPTGTMQILAAPGYGVDFSGRPATTLSAAGITGTTRGTVSGAYSGTINDNYTYTVSGSGTVGVTPGLRLNVTNTSGAILASLNIGQGYAPGTVLNVANGVTVSLTSGTANNGDVFSSPVIAKPDTVGLLTALGIGTFFTGNTAATLGVRSAVVRDPNLLATSRTGQPADATNLHRLSSLEDALLFNNNTETLSGFYNSLLGDVGNEVKSIDTVKTSQSTLDKQLRAQQQSISGVDTNEELVNLLSFQRSFETASKYISVINQTLDSLINIL